MYYSDLAASLIGDGGLYLVGLLVLLALLHWLLPDMAPAPGPWVGPRPFTERQFARLFWRVCPDAAGRADRRRPGLVFGAFAGAAIPTRWRARSRRQRLGGLFLPVYGGAHRRGVLFRWLLYKKLTGFGETVYILTSGLMFGLFHGNFEQFLRHGPGWLLAWAVCRTGECCGRCCCMRS